MSTVGGTTARAHRRRPAARVRADVPMRTVRVVPFVACAALGLATLLIPPYVHHVGRLLLAGGLLTGLVAAAVMLPWERWPRWVEAAPPLAFFGVIAVMRDASGGAASGLAPMVALPVLWLALFGSRHALLLAAGATGAVFVLPVVLVGGPAYPADDLRRGALWVAVVLLIGPSLQAVVRALERREQEQAVLNADLAAAAAQWSSFADQLPDTTVLIVDEQLRYRLVAGAGAMRQGVDGWQGRTLEETSSPENVALLAPLFRAAFAGRSGRCELVSTVTGTAHEVTVVPFEHRGDRAAMVVARDVSLAQGREAEIRALSHRLERLVDEAPAGICACDAHGGVEQMNDAMRRLLDLESTDVPDGTTLASLGLLPPGSSAVDLTRTSPTGHWAGEVQLARAEQEPLDLALDLVSMLDVAGDVEALVLHARDISEHRRFEARLAHLADHDPLTGLANRRRFDEALEHHLREGARYGLEGAVLMLDLDHFKEVNDTFGHQVGDEVIVSVAGTIRRLLRQSDTLARLGGDEFAVLMSHGGREEVERVCERIVEAVRSRATATEVSAVHAVTVSVGAVVLHDPETTASEVLSSADMTMYDAKDAGRAGFVVFDPRETAPGRTAVRINWSAKIRAALREERFVLHAQPIVDLRSRELVGAELLLRMVDEDGALVGPGRFLYVAERMGLASQIDLWVIEHGLARLDSLHERGTRLRLSVNVSAHSLDDPDVIETIERLVRSSSVEPGQLVFEITETAAIANMERARSFARRVHDLGCLLALDDFGAGNGSFYNLKHLPFDCIKIDGEFVRSCTSNEFDRLVVQSVMTFAAGTGRTVVAEYVVDEPTAQLLDQMSVDQGQGFYLGRPLTWPELEALLPPPAPPDPADGRGHPCEHRS